jgi:hypothetical protein
MGSRLIERSTKWQATVLFLFKETSTQALRTSAGEKEHH